MSRELEPRMVYSLDEQQCRNLEVSTRREWILTNGLGGYAMGTASGINTRRYHGHLIAAIHPPTDRMVLLAQVEAFIQAGGNPLGISANQYPGAIHPEGFHYLRDFSVGSSARWRYKAAGMEVLKTLYLHQGENAVTITYRNLGEGGILLTLRPFVCHKPHHQNFTEQASYPQDIQFQRHEFTIRQGEVSLYVNHEGAQRVPVHGWYYRFEHQRETERGLDPRDDLYCPCELRYELLPGESATLVASTEPGAQAQLEVEDKASDHKLLPFLKDAASRFVVKSQARTTIIAGYPWFTDWGRDTMISLPGICLHTGRVAEARQILLDYASQCREGLVPNRFVEVGEPDYNTVDATLWFANAIYKILVFEWDESFAEAMAETLDHVFRYHMAGTLYGIYVDKSDGLLCQGMQGTQLTWMDAKIGDWVVTPRNGKPVEINGLWINALRVMEWLAQRLGRDGAAYRAAAEKAEDCFEDTFWHELRGHYVDTADPLDVSLRPNQLIAMALPFGPAKGEKAVRALDVVTRELLTPFGLRSLGPSEPSYRGKFTGSMNELDASYHQGTVWPWLLGPYVSALVRLKGDKQEGKRILRQTKHMLLEYGLGGIAEVYDGDPPQAPGGCPWQAWSVAEILRSWVEDVDGD